MQDLSEFASGEEYDAQYGDSYEDEIVALTCLANDTGLSWGSHSIG